MTSFKSILVATDFSVDSHHAVRKAALLAQQHEAQLTVLHVVNRARFNSLREWFSSSIDTDLKTAQARATLRQFAAEIAGRHGVAVTFEVLVADALAEILRRSERADLVVLGQRGKNPFKDLVIGSTADRLLRKCRRPMLVVKRAVGDPYRQILVPVDFTADSEAALHAAAGLVPNADIHVFHALNSSGESAMRQAEVPAAVIREYREMEDGKACARMHGLIATLGMPSGRVSAALGRGRAWRSTLDQADALRADLIVAGKPRRSALADFLLGSVTRRLLAHSKCDLLVVPRAAFEALPANAAAAPPKALAAEGDTARLARAAGALMGTHAKSQAPVHGAGDGGLSRLAWK